MEILLTYISLFILFIVAILLACRINIRVKQYITNAFIVIGLALIFVSEERKVSIFLFALFLIWTIIGVVTYRVAPVISVLIDKILCKLTGQRYEQMKDDLLDDSAPETAIKVRYYIVAGALYIIFLMSVLPGIT